MELPAEGADPLDAAYQRVNRPGGVVEPAGRLLAFANPP
jgi:hypothetical protein